MKDLVTINNKVAKGPHKIIARDLHRALESKQKYTNWIQARIESYGFIEGYDFILMRDRSITHNNNEITEHLFTLEASKHLCLVERTDKGKQVRQYFIDVESQWKERGEWKAVRFEGKSVRRHLTDVIANFIEYAFSQGSKNADKYFTIYTKLLNSELFENPKAESSLRDLLNIPQLHQVSVGEQILIRAITDGMRAKHFYKDIYQEAKLKLNSYSFSIGKSRIGQSEKQTLNLEFTA